MWPVLWTVLKCKIPCTYIALFDSSDHSKRFTLQIAITPFPLKPPIRGTSQSHTFIHWWHTAIGSNLALRILHKDTSALGLEELRFEPPTFWLTNGSLYCGHRRYDLTSITTQSNGKINYTEFLWKIFWFFPPILYYSLIKIMTFRCLSQYHQTWVIMITGQNTVSWGPSSVFAHIPALSRHVAVFA